MVGPRKLLKNTTRLLSENALSSGYCGRASPRHLSRNLGRSLCEAIGKDKSKRRTKKEISILTKDYFTTHSLLSRTAICSAKAFVKECHRCIGTGGKRRVF
jgi:hypothetical protein